MYQLDSPLFFYLLLIIPVVWVIAFFVGRWRRRAQQQFATPEMLRFLSPNRSHFKGNIKLILFSLALLSLVVALVNPKVGSELETVRREGVDIVFAVDVSKSMLAEDVAPNRVEKAKHLVSSILNELAGDRIGIVAYAAQAIPQLPITTDYSAARMFLQALNTDMLSSQGTDLSSAIELAVTYFEDSQHTNKVIFILSDGEDHQQDLGRAINIANDDQVKIFSIGIGTDNGAPIPIRVNGIVESYKRDLEQNVVMTKRNTLMLEKIATDTNGEYQDGNDTVAVLEFVSQVLDRIDKREFEAQEFVSYKDRFQPFLLLALLLLFMDVFIFHTKTRWIQRMNLFNEQR